MASRPDDQAAHDRHEAAAAALLLLRRRYDLPALVKRSGINPRAFRRIAPTEALRGTLAAPYLLIPTAWADERDSIVNGYETARATSDGATAQWEVNHSTAAIAALLPGIIRRLPVALGRLEQWHRIQWVARIKAATGLDVAMFTSADDAATAIDNARVWNERLVADVHRQIAHRVSAAVLAGVATGAPAAVVRGQVNEAIVKARKRSAAIAVDQVGKATEAMTRARASAAGMSFWRWRHLDPQPHPRPEHQLRDGKVYSDTRPPPEQPGALFGCHCWGEPLFR